MCAEKFEGYSNNPTLIVNWLKDNEDSQNYWKIKALQFSREELTKELRPQIEEIHNPITVKASIYSNLLDYSIGWIHWDEIVDLLKKSNGLG